MSDAMLDKVRKLLAKAEDPACTPEEAAAFTDKAAELIAKYGVDRALLAARDPTTDAVGDRTVEVLVYPHLELIGPRRLTGSGLHAGRDAGHRADLGGGRVPSGRRRPGPGPVTMPVSAGGYPAAAA